MGRFDEAIRIYQFWDRPQAHVAAIMAACHAMNGDFDEARRLAVQFLASCPEGFRMEEYHRAMLRYIATEEGRALWTAGFEGAGLLPAGSKTSAS